MANSIFSKIKQKEIKALIEKGKKQGYLILSEINDILPQNLHDGDQIEEIKKLYDDSEVGLVLVSDDLTEEINDKLTKLRAEQSTPLVFALPASGSEKSEVDYRVMLKKILGV